MLVVYASKVVLNEAEFWCVVIGFDGEEIVWNTKTVADKTATTGGQTLSRTGRHREPQLFLLFQCSPSATNARCYKPQWQWTTDGVRTGMRGC